MRDLWGRLGLLNQVSLVIVFVAFAAGLGAVILVTSPLAGVIISAAAVALVAFCFWFFFHDEVRGNRLRRRGVPSQATILAVEETGITVQGNYPLANLRLLVEPATGEPYEATAKCLMNRFDIPAYQPGSRIAVVVDPRNRKKVAVV